MTKAFGGNDQEEAALYAGQDLEAAVGSGDGGGDGFAAADNDHIGAGDLGAGCVRYYAADGGRRAIEAEAESEKGMALNDARDRMQQEENIVETDMMTPSSPSERMRVEHARTGLLTCAYLSHLPKDDACGSPSSGLRGLRDCGRTLAEFLP